MTRTLMLLAALTIGASTPGGCANPDPTKGFTTLSQHRPGIRSVAVPIWKRGTHEYRRDIEMRITESLVKHIEGSTPYKVVDEARADTLLTGTLQRVKQNVLNFDPRFGTPREVQIQFICDFTWKDLRTGQILAQRKDYRVSSTYIPPSPFREDFYLGSEDAVNLLARRIVENLANPW